MGRFCFCHGKTVKPVREEDICQGLGDPKDLIREIQDMMDVPAGTHEVGRPVIELEKENHRSEKFQKKAYKGRLYQEQQTQNFGHALKKVRFYADSADIRLIPSADREFYVYTEDDDEMDYLEHNCYEDTYEGRVRRSSGSFFGIDIFHSFMGGPVDTGIMVIPEGIEDIRIETISGEVSCKDCALDKVVCNSISGEILVKQAKDKEKKNK